MSHAVQSVAFFDLQWLPDTLHSGYFGTKTNFGPGKIPWDTLDPRAKCLKTLQTHTIKEIKNDIAICLCQLLAGHSIYTWVQSMSEC